MARFVRAYAFDFDGTLTTEARPSKELLDNIARRRAEGRKTLLVTGRIGAELRDVFPDVDQHFDRVILENGALIASDRVTRLPAPPVDPALDAILGREGVPFRRGEVILALAAGGEPLVSDGVRLLGLDCQLVRNRNELMVIPAGVSKGHGVLEALAEVGVSCHNTVAVGDAENDLALLEACGLGVGVFNAVESVKRAADWVLSRANGAGIIDLLSDDSFPASGIPHPRRWHIEVGRSADGSALSLPASQVNVLVSGPTTSGKSYVAGLLAEQSKQPATSFSLRSSVDTSTFHRSGECAAAVTAHGAIFQERVDVEAIPTPFARFEMISRRFFRRRGAGLLGCLRALPGRRSMHGAGCA